MPPASLPWKAVRVFNARLLGVGAALLEHHLGSLLDFIRRKLFLVGCDEPNMPERIFQCACPVTVKLILHRSERLGTGINGPSKYGIYVFHVHMKTNWRAA